MPGQPAAELAAHTSADVTPEDVSKMSPAGDTEATSVHWEKSVRVIYTFFSSLKMNF